MNKLTDAINKELENRVRIVRSNQCRTLSDKRDRFALRARGVKSAPCYFEADYKSDYDTLQTVYKKPERRRRTVKDADGFEYDYRLDDLHK